MLNDIDIWAADVLNAYTTTPCHEKILTTLGKQFGVDFGKKAIVVQALYGLKSSGAAFRAHLAGCMQEMGYRSCPADTDLWLKEQTDKKGRQYYSYNLCYVDDLLVVHHNPKQVMDRFNGFLLLSDSVGPLEIYLGAKLRRRPLHMAPQHGGSVPLSMSNKLLRMSRPSSSRTIQGSMLCQSKLLTHFPVIMPPKRMCPHCSSPLLPSSTCS